MGKVPMKVGCDMKVEMRMTCYLQSKLAQPHRDSCHRLLQFHIDTNTYKQNTYVYYGEEKGKKQNDSFFTRGEEKVWRK
jgi:hypothetical protein